MSIDKVAADHFYKDRGDQNKQNWFLYEYANVLFSKIGESPALAGYRRKRGERDIIAFCVYFSKRLRQSIFNARNEPGSGVAIDTRYIYEFYPDNLPAQTQRLINAAMEAWNEHILICANCPNQCLTESFEPTRMFDNLEKTGWPTV